METRLKYPLAMLAEDGNIDPQFRQILGGDTGLSRVSTTELHRGTGMPSAPLAMTAHSDGSKTMLTEAAEILCGTDAEMKLLQSVYNVAVLDGRLEQAKEMLDHIPRELKA